MIYADYSYYEKQYHGTMQEADFVRLAPKASAYIDNLTLQRAEGASAGRFESKIKDSCCAAADAYLLNEQGGGVVSETVGKLTRNYAAGVSNTPTETQRLHDAAGLYLTGTGLMYRGV